MSLRVAVFVLVCGVTLGAQVGYVPERVFDSARGQFSDFEAMLADVAKADVVFVGEQHNDPNTHRLELAVLQGLARRRGDVVLSLEMFERDVQDPLDRFATGRIAEDEFLKSSRPWPRYATDYKPLVDFAVDKKWPVVAGNVPRPLASEVSKAGLEALKMKTDAQKAWFAADVRCPTKGDYYRNFVEAMSGHSAGGGTPTPASSAPTMNVDYFYFAQCLKDETMGESIARAYEAGAIGGKHPLVVHINGAFHSDFALGTAERAQRRLPKQRVVVISMLPVPNLDTVAPDKKERKRADYLVYTVGK